MPSGDLTSGAHNSGTTTHPTYGTWARVWRWLSYVYEGSGPFLTGDALIAHPREYLDHTIVTKELESETDASGTVTTGQLRTVTRVNPNPKIESPKFKERKRLARYENLAAPIVQAKLTSLFRQGPTRRIAGDDKAQEHEWLDWAEHDVDGAGTPLTDFMRDAERIAMIFGHAVILMDRQNKPGVVQPKTKAEQGTLVLRLYAPLDMPDWLQGESGQLTAVKLYEAIPRTSLKDSNVDATMYRLRYVDQQGFEVVDQSRNGKVSTTADQGQHGFKTLPVVILYTERRALTPLIGKSVLGDPQNHVDVYNMTSETRELLRKQTFSVLNVPLGTGDGAMSVDQAKALIGETIGTANVLFSGQQAAYLSADSANVTVYQEERRQLIRTIYRLANVPFETDSKDAEAAESLVLKREDMNTVLAGYGDELEKAETQINTLWFQGTYGDSWEAEYEKVQPSTSYPDTFDLTSIENLLAQASQAMATPLGRSKTFMYELCYSLAQKILPNASPAILDKISKELSALPDPEQERQEKLKMQMSAFKEAGGPPEDDDKGGKAA